MPWYGYVITFVAFFCLFWLLEFACVAKFIKQTFDRIKKGLMAKQTSEKEHTHPWAEPCTTACPASRQRCTCADRYGPGTVDSWGCPLHGASSTLSPGKATPSYHNTKES